MLTQSDIIATVETWKDAGLTPPQMNNPKDFERYCNGMLAQYRNTPVELWAKAVDQLAHGKRWATFFDIDRALSELRYHEEAKKNIPREVNTLQAEENRKKMAEIIAAVGAGKSLKSLIQPPTERIRQIAKRLFPDCNEEFIKREQANLSFVGDAMDKCERCNYSTDCEFGGHRPFLKIDKKGGFTTVFAEREKCGKYQVAR